jgi:5'-methylthioadenosine phosphorylase
MCYANIALVTDYDVGIADDPDAAPVQIDEVIRVLNDNNERVKKLLMSVIKGLPELRTCDCEDQARQARLG